MKVIVVTSGKGGVGKDLVVNGLWKNLDSVIVIELDYSTSNLKESSDVVKPPKGFTTKASAKAYIKRSMRIAKERDVEYVLINTPPTLSSIMTAIVEELETFNLLFVTTPSDGAKQDTLRGINYYRTNGKSNILGLVQNMVGSDFGYEFDSEDEMDINTLVHIELSDKNEDAKFKLLTKKVMELALDTTTVPSKEDEYSSIDEDYIYDTFGSYELMRKNKPLLRYFNAETWDAVKECIEKYDGNPMADGIFRGRNDPIIETSSRDCKKIEDEEYFWIMVNKILPVEGSPKVPFIMHRAKKVQKENFLYVPMAMLENGTLLWLHECMIYTDADLTQMPEYKPYSEDIMRPELDMWLAICDQFFRHNLSEEELVKLYKSIEKG